MSVDVRRDIIQILSLNQDIASDWEILKTEYRALDIDKVIIDGNTFTNYGDFQFIWEMSYVTEPKRSGNGSIGNLNSYAVFLTPHLTLNFSIMSIDDYRKIMQLHYAIKEHTVECYDPIYNRKIKVKMYFATEQMAKLHTIARKRFNGTKWEDWIELVGVREYTVDLIGTNNDIDTITFGYAYNAPLDDYGNPIYPNGVPVPNQYEQDVYTGEEISIGQSCTFIDTPPTGYVFSHWEDSNGTIYFNGSVITVNNNTMLKAIWKSPNVYSLGFNYGISPISQDDNTEFVRYIANNQPIGVLPKFNSPFVELDGEKYYPYENGAWYKNPTKSFFQNNKVKDNEEYWEDKDTIVYLLFDIKKFTVNYVPLNGDLIIPISTAYGDPIYLPTLNRQGYKFMGWYLNNKLLSSSDRMPPYSITLTAKWEKEK